MKTKIMYGAPVVEALENLNKHLISTFEVKPKLGIITVDGGDDASKVYVSNKLKAAERTGIIAYHYQTSIDELSKTICQAEEECDGVIIQRPFGESCETVNEQHYCDSAFIELLVCQNPRSRISEQNTDGSILYGNFKRQGKGLDCILVCEEFCEITEGEMPGAILKSIQDDKYQRQGNKEYQKHRVWQSPCTSFSHCVLLS